MFLKWSIHYKYWPLNWIAAQWESVDQSRLTKSNPFYLSVWFGSRTFNDFTREFFFLFFRKAQKCSPPTSLSQSTDEYDEHLFDESCVLSSLLKLRINLFDLKSFKMSSSTTHFSLLFKRQVFLSEETSGFTLTNCMHRIRLDKQFPWYEFEWKMASRYSWNCWKLDALEQWLNL